MCFIGERIRLIVLINLGIAWIDIRLNSPGTNNDENLLLLRPAYDLMVTNIYDTGISNMVGSCGIEIKVQITCKVITDIDTWAVLSLSRLNLAKEVLLNK
jgi:hypothetical protein